MRRESDESTWAEWSKHVILSIERLDTRIDELSNKITLMRDDVIQLRTRSSIIWSVIGAVAGALITLGVLMFVKVV